MALIVKNEAPTTFELAMRQQAANTALMRELNECYVLLEQLDN